MTSEGAYAMCRTCLNNSFPFSNIFKELLGEGYVYEVLMDLCQLEVSSEDVLPEYVCFDCHKNISKFHSFKLQTHESNAALHRLKIKHEIKIEPASSFTSCTPNSGSSLKSTSRTMKECYVRLSRCDQLLQVGYSPKVNIKTEKEDPSYLGDNESGNIQGADVQLPVGLLGEGDSPSASKGANEEKLREETLQANTQGVVKLNEVLCSVNLFSNGKEFEGDDIEIHEEKPYSENASLTRFSPQLHFTDNTAKGVGNLSIRAGDHPSDEAYIESEPQEIKETSENGCVTVDSNLKYCEGDPEDIISRLLERSVHRGVELSLDRSHDEKSLDNGGFKFQEREHLEEMQFECEIFEKKFETDYTCRKPRDIYQTRNVRHNSVNSFNEFRSSECIDERCLMRESDIETVKSDNVDSKTYRKESRLLEDSQVQLRKVNNRDLCDIMVCDHCSKEFKEKSDLLKHLVRFKREYTCKRHQKIHKMNKDFVRHDEKHNFKAWCSMEFIEKTSVMREHDKLHVESDNLVAKTYGKRGSFCEDSNVQLQEEENGDFLNILVCDYCRVEFHEKSDLLKHLVVHSGKSNFCRLSEKTEVKGNVLICTSDSTKKRGSKKCKRRLSTKNLWKCKWCGKEFTCASALKYHERVHTGEKPFSCKYCSRKFRMKRKLSYHELIHAGVKPHVCTYCSKKFTRKDVLRQHELTHTGIKPFSCKFCSKSFYHKANLYRHELIHTGVKPFSCSYCSKKFSQKMHLKRHELTHTGVKPFSCKFCSKSFYQKSLLNNHELTHTGINPFSCKFCSKSFYQKGDLNRHELIHTGVKPFSCSYCTKKFNLKSNLNKHERIHTGVKPFSCKFCSKSFYQKGDLNRHELIHTGVKPFSCSYCSKKFNQMMHLKNHKLTHTGIKPFSCKFCSKSFYQKSLLKNHELTHTGIKPFSCMFCSKSFYQKGDLNRHELIHTGVKPFSCSYCTKKFNLKSSLKKHELIHTRVKPFSCKFCSKQFTTSSKLNKHELIHTGVKPFSCSYCSKRFNQKGNLKLHERIHTGVRPFSLRLRQNVNLEVHEGNHNRVLSCS